jgi:hypothetical protein
MTDVKMLYLATVTVRILHRPFRFQPWSCIIGSVRATVTIEDHGQGPQVRDAFLLDPRRFEAGPHTPE